MTIDIKQILSSPDVDDAIRRLICKGPWKHEWYGGTYSAPECRKCGFTKDDIDTNKSCSHPPPIALDANLAEQMRDEAVKEYGELALDNQLVSIWRMVCEKGGYSLWLACRATPPIRILAAFMAGEAE